MLYLYYMIAVELSLWTDFCLFDQRNTSAAHQLTVLVTYKGLFKWREGAPANRATLGGLTSLMFL